MWQHGLCDILTRLEALRVRELTFSGGRVKVKGPPGSLRRVQASGLLRKLPPPCPVCGSISWWLSIHGQVVCAFCHPPADPSLVACQVTVVPSRYCWGCVHFNPSSTKGGLGWCGKCRVFKVPEAPACKHFQASKRRVA